MPKPYSYDFRKKVIEAIELNGLKKSEASEYFNLSRNTINLWLRRREETGDIGIKKDKKPGPSGKITDWEKFENFVQIYGDKTQVEMAELWEEDLSERTICRAIKKIGFTRKKNLWVS